MALSSMTGFARSHGTRRLCLEWELKSVNGKGLDLRLRLPPGWDDVERRSRKRASDTLARGTVYANLTSSARGVASSVRVNEAVLGRRSARRRRLRRPGRRRAADARWPACAQGRGRDRRAGEPTRRRADGARRGAGGFDEALARSCRHAAPRGLRRSATSCGSGSTKSNAWPRGPSRAGASARGDEGDGSPSRSRRCLRRPSGSIRPLAARKRSCSPPSRTFAKSSTASPRMLPRRGTDRQGRARSAAGSIFWPRNSIAKSTPPAPRPTISS